MSLLSHHERPSGGPPTLPNPRHGQYSTTTGYYPPIPSASSHVSPPPPRHGHLEAELPRLAPNPWVVDFWKWLGENTIGVARVDLRRPMPPSPDQYGSNLLFAHYKHGPGNGHTAQWRPFSGRGGAASPPAAPIYGQPQPQYPQPHGNQKHQPQSAYPPQPYGQARAYPQVPYGAAVTPPPVEERPTRYAQEPTPPPCSGPPSGARVKITRSFLLGRGEEKEDKPMVDIGGGINIDMDRQQVQPVLRMKLRDILSIKLLPYPSIKIAKSLPLGNTGMGVKLHYEVPLDQMQNFYRPPARLMIRLDPIAGSGFRFTPSGIDFDQQSVRFGKNITLRASAGVVFPRTLPIDPENDDVGLKVQRLSLKALW